MELRAGGGPLYAGTRRRQRLRNDKEIFRFNPAFSLQLSARLQKGGLTDTSATREISPHGAATYPRQVSLSAILCDFKTTRLVSREVAAGFASSRHGRQSRIRNAFTPVSARMASQPSTRHEKPRQWRKLVARRIPKQLQWYHHSGRADWHNSAAA